MLATCWLSWAHGSNAQKTMGVVAATLYTAGFLEAEDSDSLVESCSSFSFSIVRYVDVCCRTFVCVCLCVCVCVCMRLCILASDPTALGSLGSPRIDRDGHSVWRVVHY